MATLTGIADTYPSKYEAEDAAYRVYGVIDVTNNIVVDPAARGLRMDSAIAADIRHMWTLDLHVPETRLDVQISDGNVTLSGQVDWSHQRNAAERDARAIAGVRSLSDTIRVQAPPSSVDISEQITRAFARNGELLETAVSVAVDGHHVTLDGSVRTWGEFGEAEDVAWRAVGVTNVTNKLLVTY